MAHPAGSRIRRLLVVDDEPHIGLLLQLQLESRGYELRLARSLFEARGALKTDWGPPDGILLDIHLPDGSGVDLLRELRERPATATIPVLVLTAEGEERVLAEARRLGAQTITKPFSPTKLRAQVAALVGDTDPDAAG
ncbi:MAG TPA: response regulator [Gemmatimonadales bacterium]|nr:response regulator [Gemmatimonadales bacterium]